MFNFKYVDINSNRGTCAEIKYMPICPATQSLCAEKGWSTSSYKARDMIQYSYLAPAK